MGLDLGTVLKLIGGIKQLKVGSVFAEGTNIIKQSPGASIFGSGSLLNTIAPLQTLFSQNGLSGIFTNNPVAANASNLQSTVSGAIPAVTAITTTTNSGTGMGGGQTTVTPKYPLFIAALTAAESTLAQYYYMSELLSGQVVPDYDNNEYGLTDILDVSSSGSAALSDLIAPLTINSTLTTALTQLITLVQNVTSSQIADSDAVTQLNTLMTPIVSSVQTSQTAYNSSNETDTQSTVIGIALGYVNGVPSEEGDFVQSLLDPPLVPLIIAQNQQLLSEVDENKASAKLERIEKERVHRLTVQLLEELGRNKET